MYYYIRIIQEGGTNTGNIVFKGQVHSKNNLLLIKAEKSDKPIKKCLSKIG